MLVVCPLGFAGCPLRVQHSWVGVFGRWPHLVVPRLVLAWMLVLVLAFRGPCSGFLGAIMGDDSVMHASRKCVPLVVPDIGVFTNSPPG